MTDADTLPVGTRLGRVALRVADLQRMTGSYRQILDASVLDRDGERAVLGVDGRPLLVLRAAPDAPARDDDEAGLFHTAVRVPSRAALGDALARIRDNATLTGASDHLVSEALYCRDPEGNGLEVCRDFPRAEWPRRADGRVEIDTVPLSLGTVAAAAASDNTAPPGTDVGHVHREVTSLGVAAKFYGRTLGFERQGDPPQARFLSAGGYHHHVGLNTWNGRTAAADDGSRGLAWFEVVVPDADAVAAVRSRLTAADVPLSETASRTGIAATDPDGVRVRVVVEQDARTG